METFLQCSWTFNAEAWAFSIPTGNFHFVRASVPERLALPASNVAVGSVFNLDFPILYVLHGNKELTLSEIEISLKPSNLYLIIPPNVSIEGTWLGWVGPLNQSIHL